MQILRFHHFINISITLNRHQSYVLMDLILFDCCLVQNWWGQIIKHLHTSIGSIGHRYNHLIVIWILDGECSQHTAT